MDEKEFLQRSDECLKQVAQWLEEFDPDEVDYSSGDGALTMEFADGGKFVLSRQTAMSQIWLAAESSGYHFVWDPSAQAWLDEKDREKLSARLAHVVGDKLGREIEPF